MPVLELRDLAHVEHLRRRCRVEVGADLLDGDPLQCNQRMALGVPARPAARKQTPTTRRGRQPDGRREAAGTASVLVVAAHEHDLRGAGGKPCELGAEAAAVQRNRDRSGHVPLRELNVGTDVDDQRALTLALARAGRETGAGARCLRSAAARG